MKLRMDFLEPGLIDMRIDLSRCNTGVTQHFLHLPEVGTPGQHMRRKAVSHRVGTDRDIDISL